MPWYGESEYPWPDFSNYPRPDPCIRVMHPEACNAYCRACAERKAKDPGYLTCMQKAAAIRTTIVPEGTPAPTIALGCDSR